MKGVDILIFANTGTVATPVWTQVGGQRGAKMSESVKPIDVTTKASTADEFEYGRGTATISCDGLYVPDDAAVTALRDALRNKTNLTVRWKESGTATVEATALITSFEVDAPDGEAATYSCELQVTGAITADPTP